MPTDIPQGTDPFDTELDALKRILEGEEQPAPKPERVGGLVQAFKSPTPGTPKELQGIPFAGPAIGTAALLYSIPVAAKNMLAEGINTAGRWLNATHQLPGAKATDDLVIPKGGSLEDAQVNPQRLMEHDFLAPLGLASMAASPAGKMLAGRLSQLPKDRLAHNDPTHLRLLSDQQRSSTPGAIGNAFGRETELQAGAAKRPSSPEVDAAGFYSKALEVVKSLPQEKMTPEQAIGALKNAGVKEGELEATGLRSFLQDSPSVTKSSLIKFLQENRVKVEEKRYGDSHIPPHIQSAMQERDALIAKAEQMYDAGKRDTPEYQQIGSRINRLHDTIDDWDRAGAGSTKWSTYSLDKGKNPTYRETVVHLPSKVGYDRAQVGPILDAYKSAITDAQSLLPSRDRMREEYFFEKGKSDRQYILDQLSGRLTKVRGGPQAMEKLRKAYQAWEDEGGLMLRSQREDFNTGHWSEPNVLFHARTSLQKDAKGRTVFHVDELQSDWSQEIRNQIHNAYAQDNVWQEARHWLGAVWAHHNSL